MHAPRRTPEPSTISKQPAMAPVNTPEDTAMPAATPAPLLPRVPALEQLLTTVNGKCGSVMTAIRMSEHEPLLTAPKMAAEYYGNLRKDGTFPMTYGEIQNGGEYCISAGSTAPQVVFGGTMFWHNNGRCHLPPTKKDGSSCCNMFMWQPNGAGYYHDNCSMK